MHLACPLTQSVQGLEEASVRSLEESADRRLPYDVHCGMLGNGSEREPCILGFSTLTLYKVHTHRCYDIREHGWPESQQLLAARHV